jgi:hypothetical protein
MLEKEIINIFIISTLFGSEGHGLRVKNTIWESNSASSWDYTGDSLWSVVAALF